MSRRRRKAVEDEHHRAAEAQGGSDPFTQLESWAAEGQTSLVECWAARTTVRRRHEALCHAATYGCAELLRFFPGLVLRNARTIQVLAVQHGQLNVLDTILDMGASPSLDALHAAVFENHIACTLRLLHVWKDTALIWASYYGRLAIVDMLLSRQADLRAADDAPLCAAACRGQVSVLRRLLELGANACAQHNKALRAAIELHDAAMAHLLLDYGADVHVNGDWALKNIWSHKAPDVNLVACLLWHGADLRVVARYPDKPALHSMLEEWNAMDAVKMVADALEETSRDDAESADDARVLRNITLQWLRRAFYETWIKHL